MLPHSFNPLYTAIWYYVTLRSVQDSDKMTFILLKSTNHHDRVYIEGILPKGPYPGDPGAGTGEFPAQRPVTRSFDVFFDLRLNKRLSKQSRGWWFETPSRSLWPGTGEFPHKSPVTRKMFPFDDVIMIFVIFCIWCKNIKVLRLWYLG